MASHGVVESMEFKQMKAALVGERTRREQGGKDKDEERAREIALRKHAEKDTGRATNKLRPITVDSRKPAASCMSCNTKKPGRNLVYCTQRCLRGLLEGGMLDKSCPNHELHRKHGDHHSITSKTFLSLMQQQLFHNPEADCYPLNIQGSRGALFQVRLISHGYTGAAKCTVYAYVSDLIHEGSVYKQLEKIQGIYVPVCLGNIDLDRVFSYDWGVQITHMMFMSWGGNRVDREPNLPNLQLVTRQALDAIHAIHELGILHQDVMPRNLLWNEEVQRVMFIDFERSFITTPTPSPPLLRPTINSSLIPISLNGKQKRTFEIKNTSMIDLEEQGQGQGLEKPNIRILSEDNGETEVHEVEPEAKSLAKSFSLEVDCLKGELSEVLDPVRVIKH